MRPELVEGPSTGSGRISDPILRVRARWATYPQTASPSAGPQTENGNSSTDITFSPGVRSPASIATSIGAAASVTSVATIPPGTAATRTGTGRPASPGIHRGNTSPHGRIRPTVSTAPSVAAPPSSRPQSRISGVIAWTGPANCGNGVSQVARASAYGTGPS